jgi:hypothetical protein
MGQQQLLLIVLGVIIVGIAVVVGINLFNASAEESTKDTITAECTNLGAMALQYYKKPVALAGGGNAFDASKGGVGFTIPVALLTTSSGTYVATPTATDCTIVGTPITGTNYGWKVTLVVTSAGVYTTTIN